MAITSTSIDLSWLPATDNVGVTQYIVKYTENLGVPQTKTVAGNILSTTITGLNPNTLYIFTLTAKDAANNESLQSNVVTATTLEA